MFDHFAQFTCVTPTPTKRHILGPNHSRGELPADAIDRAVHLAAGMPFTRAPLAPNQFVRIEYNSQQGRKEHFRSPVCVYLLQALLARC